MPGGGISIGGILYLVIGLIVASSHGYLADLGTLSGILSALLGILLWPLVLFGANVHITLGVGNILLKMLHHSF